MHFLKAPQDCIAKYAGTPFPALNGWTDTKQYRPTILKNRM